MPLSLWRRPRTNDSEETAKKRKTQLDGRRLPANRAPARPPLAWYFVFACNAKWFGLRGSSLPSLRIEHYDKRAIGSLVVSVTAVAHPATEARHSQEATDDTSRTRHHRLPRLPRRLGAIH